MKSVWQLSDAFFCKEERGSCATMQCKMCGLVFEADIEEMHDSDLWIILTAEGSNWKQMLLKCPACPNHEEHKTRGRCAACNIDEIVIPEPTPEELRFEQQEAKRSKP